MRLKEAIPRYYFTNNFRFPATLETGMVFDDPNAVQKYLQDQANALKVPLHRMVNDRDYYPSAGNWTSVRYRCKVCRISLRFSKRDGAIVANTVNNEHRHAELSHRNLKLEPDEDDGNETTPAINECVVRRRTRSRSSLKSEPMTKSQQLMLGTEQEQQKITSQLNVFLPTSNESNFTSLLQWVSDHEYQGRGDVSKSSCEPSNIIMLISPLMLNSYIRFGDLLDFRIIHDLLLDTQIEGSGYKVGVFSVFDTNEVPLLAGFALLREETPRTISQILRSFCVIHNKPPVTLVTGNETYVLDAVDQMINKKHFQGTHQVNSDVLLANLREIPQVSITESSATIANVMEALVCRDHDKYRSILADLNSSSLYRTVEPNIKKRCSFYCESPNSGFAGLGVAKPTKLINAVRAILEKKPTILDFVDKINELDSNFKSKSLRRFEKYEEDIAKVFSNHRLNEVRDNFEVRIVERFMENYIWAVRNCLIIGRPLHSGEQSLVVKHSMNGETRFNVENWKCDCRELERTGVACAHLILLATLEVGKSFLSLVSPRWRKCPIGLPEAQEKLSSD